MPASPLRPTPIKTPASQRAREPQTSAHASRSTRKPCSCSTRALPYRAWASRSSSGGAKPSTVLPIWATSPSSPSPWAWQHPSIPTSSTASLTPPAPSSAPNTISACSMEAKTRSSTASPSGHPMSTSSATRAGDADRRHTAKTHT